MSETSARGECRIRSSICQSAPRGGNLDGVEALFVDLSIQDKDLDLNSIIDLKINKTRPALSILCPLRYYHIKGGSAVAPPAAPQCADERFFSVIFFA